MGINFDGSTVNQNIGFGAILSGLSQKTIMTWVYLDVITPYKNILGKYYASGSDIKGWYLSISNGVVFGQYWSTTPGLSVLWSAVTGLSAGALTHIAVSYDWSSTINDPVIYINGISRTVTESPNPPSGVYLEQSSEPFKIGSLDVFDPPIDGRNYSTLIYNRILSATEVADAYNSRLAVPNYNGLVFAPNLVGAKGIQTFDGATLSSSNTMIDNISGAVGTPSGDPLGAADTYLTYEG